MGLHCLYRVLIDDNLNVAHISLTHSPWHIHEVFVDPDYRFNGWGRALLTLVCADADADNATLTIHIVPLAGFDADRLLAFYESFGFVRTDSTEFDWRMERTPHG